MAHREGRDLIPTCELNHEEATVPALQGVMDGFMGRYKHLHGAHVQLLPFLMGSMACKPK